MADKNAANNGPVFTRKAGHSSTNITYRSASGNECRSQKLFPLCGDE